MAKPKFPNRYYMLIAFILIGCPFTDVLASSEIDVTDFLNNGQDDATAIQSAITNTQRGYVVKLPQGTFHIATFIDMAPGVTLSGQGEAETVLKLEENFIQNNAGHGLQLFGNVFRVSLIDNKILNNGGKSLDLVALPDENNDGYADVDYFCSYDPLAYPCNVTWQSQHGYEAENEIDIELESQGSDDNVQPQTRFTWQLSSDKVAQFTNQSTDPDGDSLALLWDLGEGAPCAHLPDGPTYLHCENARHEYSSSGWYPVTLIAWDDKGLGARTKLQVYVYVP